MTDPKAPSNKHFPVDPIIDPDNFFLSASPPSPPPPPVINNPSCGYTINALGDPQHIVVARQWSVLRSPVADFLGPPAGRTPGQTIASHSMQQYLARKAYDQTPQQCRFRFQSVFGGDEVDGGDVTELKLGLMTEANLVRDIGPEMKSRVRTVGNHDWADFGTIDDADIFGLNAILEIERDDQGYAAHYTYPALGGEQNRLFKHRYIENIYRHFGQAFNPTIITDYDDETYTLAGQKQPRRFDDTNQVQQDFWKEHDQGNHKVWRALVYRNSPSTKKQDSQKSWLHMSVLRVNQDQSGQVGELPPIFIVNFDSNDFFETSNITQATKGAVSGLQVKIMRAKIDKILERHPNAHLIGFHHHKYDQIRNFKGSGMAKFYSLPQIRNVVTFHSHHGGVEDINGEKGVKRREPLYQITGPAIIDWRNGGLVMKIKPQNNDVVYEYDFLTIDPRQHPHHNQLVDQETWEYVSNKYTLPLYNARARLHQGDQALIGLHRMPQLKGSAVKKWHQYTNKFEDLFDADEGVAHRPGRVNQEVVEKSLIPGMAETAQSFLRLFRSVVYLGLKELNLDQQANDIKITYGALLDMLEKYDQHNVDQYLQDVLYGPPPPINFKPLFDNFEQALRRALAGLTLVNPGNPDLQRVAQVTTANLQHLWNFTHVYKKWLVDYGFFLSMGSQSKNYQGLTTLFKDEDFQNLVTNTQVAYPYHSVVTAFTLKVGLESAKQWREVKQGADAREVLGGMKITVDVNGTIKGHRQPNRYPQEPRLGPTPDDDPDRPFRNVTGWHGALRFSYNPQEGEGASTGAAVSLGAQYHLLNPNELFSPDFYLPLPRITFDGDIGIRTRGPFGWEVPLSLGVFVGESTGHINFGSILLGGVSISEPKRGTLPFWWGRGWGINIDDGIYNFRWMTKHYDQDRDNSFCEYQWMFDYGRWRERRGKNFLF